MEFKVQGKQAKNIYTLLEEWYHYNETPASDAHEEALRAGLRKFKKLDAVKSPKNTKYSDIFVAAGNKKAWIEVKMGHKDNLPNPRFYYDGKWKSTYATPAAPIVVKWLNADADTAAFIEDIKKFFKIENPKLGAGFGKNDPNWISVDKLRKFFAKRNDQYFFRKENVDITKIVAGHYLSGKAEETQYLQTKDDFYLFDGAINPMGLPAGIPVLKAKGDVKVRFGMRSDSYEIQAEIKFDTSTLAHSPYSILPGSKKKHPFEKYR